jgi:hypothetical protein
MEQPIRLKQLVPPKRLEANNAEPTYAHAIDLWLSMAESLTGRFSWRIVQLRRRDLEEVLEPETSSDNQLETT